MLIIKAALYNSISLNSFLRAFFSIRDTYGIGYCKWSEPFNFNSFMRFTSFFLLWVSPRLL